MVVLKLLSITMEIYFKNCLTIVIGIILCTVIFKRIDKNFAEGTLMHLHWKVLTSSESLAFQDVDRSVGTEIEHEK